MDSLVLDTMDWSQQQFGSCELGDVRRTRRLVKFAAQVASDPDASTPDQTDRWSDCKAAYRLMDQDDVTFAQIIEPHCRLTQGRQSGTWLLINDTTQLSFPHSHEVSGLGPTGNGDGQGFLLHTSMMVSAETEELAGIAAQELFYRKPRPQRKESASRRKQRDRESQVWGRVIDDAGKPRPGVRFIHLGDRGADNYEVFAHAQQQETGWVIRASSAHRMIVPATPGESQPSREASRISVKNFLKQQPSAGEYELQVRATLKRRARTATLEVRWGSIWMLRPRYVSPWAKRHAPKFIRMSVVEVREVNGPRKTEPLHWILYTDEDVQTFADAWRIIGYYEKRPLVEEFHKALKTGCQVEQRQYATAERLERITGVLSVVAVRLVQLKTVARVEPERLAQDVVPNDWLETLYQHESRRAPRWAAKWKLTTMTVHEFFRQLAMLGGFLGRKCDGQPGWITLWRGTTKLLNLVEGFRLARKKCG